jgi:hypothetical protein
MSSAVVVAALPVDLRRALIFATRSEAAFLSWRLALTEKRRETTAGGTRRHCEGLPVPPNSTARRWAFADLPGGTL